MQDDRLKSQGLELRVLMSVAWKITMNHIDQWLSNHAAGITRLQIGVLRMIQHNGASTLSDLSRMWGLDPSTLVPTVDGLEKKGWVTRQRDQDDRRRVLISITLDGEELVNSIPFLSEDDPLVGALGELENDDRHQLISLMCKLVHHMPEGAQMMKESQSRLVASGAKETYLICKQQEN